MRALSGHTGSSYLTRHRYVARIRASDDHWMSVIPHNAAFSSLDSVLSTGLVVGGYEQRSVDVQLSPTFRFSPITGVE